MDRFLEGKTALITGASRGLGRAVAEDYAALGALVAINYANNDAAAHETLQAIEAKGGKAFLIKSTQGSYEAAEELAAALDAGLLERTGSTALDILVNNAGGGPVHDVDSTTSELFDKVLGETCRHERRLVLLDPVREARHVADDRFVAHRLARHRQ